MLYIREEALRRIIITLLNVWSPPGGQCLPLNTVLSQVHERVVKNVHTAQILVPAMHPPGFKIGFRGECIFRRLCRSVATLVSCYAIVCSLLQLLLFRARGIVSVVRCIVT